MHSQPIRPLDDLETLRNANAELHKYLRCLLSENETYIIRATVESILSHQNESDRDAEKGDAAGSCFETNLADILENAMKHCNLTLKEDENDAEIVHVYQHDRRIQTFSTAEWAWQYDDGTWPWEHDSSDYEQEAHEWANDPQE